MTDMLDFYVVWNPQAGPPTVRHYSYDIAESEARRLAGLNKGQEFFVLRCLAAAKVRDPVEVRRVQRDDIPF